MKKQLYYFTMSYPYGKSEIWKYSELICLKQYFDEIIVLPLNHMGSRTDKYLVDGVDYQEPLIRNQGVALQVLKGLLNDVPMNVFIDDFWERSVYKNYYWFKTWLGALIKTRYIFSELKKRGLMNESKYRIYLYFYWGVGSSYIVPYFNKKNYEKIVVSFKGDDLLEESNHGYWPVRKAMLENATDLIFNSNFGLSYAQRKYTDIEASMKVFRMGVYFKGTALASCDGIFRIVTCSYLITLKRVDLLVKALYYCKSRIIWTHIGDGPEMSNILSLAKKLPHSIRYCMKGFVAPENIMNHYVDNKVDLFINLSIREGLPVAVMEALSAGIPIYATAVGGTPEIVDSDVGKLLKPDINPEELAVELDDFICKSDAEISLLRKNCLRKYNEYFNAEKQYHLLGKYLSS